MILPYDVKEDEQKKINYLNDYISERGYPFLDMNQYVDEIGLDYGMDFKDYGTHTNSSGAYKVTEFFENYLNSNYIKTGIFDADHRGDKKYSSWDKAYELWQKTYEEDLKQIEYNLENGIYYDLEAEE